MYYAEYILECDCLGGTFHKLYTLLGHTNVKQSNTYFNSGVSEYGLGAGVGVGIAEVLQFAKFVDLNKSSPSEGLGLVSHHAVIVALADGRVEGGAPHQVPLA